MSEEIAKVIDVLAEKLAVPAQFVTQELLKLKLVETAIWFVASIGIVIAGVLLFKLGIKLGEKGFDYELHSWFCYVIGFGSVSFAVINSVVCFETIVKILVAPTGYIITYILGALK